MDDRDFMQDHGLRADEARQAELDANAETYRLEREGRMDERADLEQTRRDIEVLSRLALTPCPKAGE